MECRYPGAPGRRCVEPRHCLPVSRGAGVRFRSQTTRRRDPTTSRRQRPRPQRPSRPAAYPATRLRRRTAVAHRPRPRIAGSRPRSRDTGQPCPSPTLPVVRYRQFERKHQGLRIVDARARDGRLRGARLRQLGGRPRDLPPGETGDGAIAIVRPPLKRRTLPATHRTIVARIGDGWGKFEGCAGSGEKNRLDRARLPPMFCATAVSRMSRSRTITSPTRSLSVRARAGHAEYRAIARRVRIRVER